MTDLEVKPDNWLEDFDFEPCGEINQVEEEALGARAAAYTGAVQDAPGCSTMVANGLSQQLIHEVNLINPGVLVSFDDLKVKLGDAAYPFLQPQAKEALAKAIRERGTTLTVNSAYRTIVQQCLLYKWRGGRGGCPYGLVASPGRSNHQGGLAIDINDHLGWKPYLERYGWKWFGDADKPHFTYVRGGTKDIRNNAIEAFQRLWNRNNPSDKIEEDGLYGDNTEGRIHRTSVKGFAIAPWDKKPRVLRFSQPMMEGSDVIKVQEALKAKGIEIFPDGMFGQNTVKAVKQFQKQNGLTEDGVIGPNTLSALLGSPAPSPAPASPKKTVLIAADTTEDAASVRVTASELNVRLAPGIDRPEIGKIRSGQVLEVVGTEQDSDNNQWLAVKAWVAKTYRGEQFVEYLPSAKNPVRVGQVSLRGSPHLHLRQQPDSASGIVERLVPGTIFTLLRQVKGSPYSPDRRTDWYEVELDGQKGFVAAYFIDVLNRDRQPTGVESNTILFTYSPLGASARTAAQDKLSEAGVSASERMAQTDRDRVLPLKAKFIRAAHLYQLPPALLAAIASRETRGGNVLNSEGYGDGGNAFGIMQVDRRYHTLVTEGGAFGQPHINQATGILRAKLREAQSRFPDLSESEQLELAVSRYNGGKGKRPPHSDEGTTGGDYMNDVWARACYYAKSESQWV